MKDLLNLNTPSSGENSCTCLENLPLAYAYVPYQVMDSTYSFENSLDKGTAFPELYKPLGVYGNEFSGRTEENHHG